MCRRQSILAHFTCMGSHIAHVSFGESSCSAQFSGESPQNLTLQNAPAVAGSDDTSQNLIKMIHEYNHTDTIFGGCYFSS